MNVPALQVIDIVTTDDAPPSLLRSFGAASKKFEPAGRMAVAIIDITRQNGGCLPQDLNEMGFTPAEVAQHYHMAKSLAAVELKLMNKSPIKPKSFLRRV